MTIPRLSVPPQSIYLNQPYNGSVADLSEGEETPVSPTILLYIQCGPLQYSDRIHGFNKLYVPTQPSLPGSGEEIKSIQSFSFPLYLGLVRKAWPLKCLVCVLQAEAGSHASMSPSATVSSSPSQSPSPSTTSSIASSATPPRSPRTYPSSLAATVTTISLPKSSEPLSPP